VNPNQFDNLNNFNRCKFNGILLFKVFAHTILLMKRIRQERSLSLDMLIMPENIILNNIYFKKIPHLNLKIKNLNLKYLPLQPFLKI